MSVSSKLFFVLFMIIAFVTRADPVSIVVQIESRAKWCFWHSIGITNIYLNFKLIYNETFYSKINTLPYFNGNLVGCIPLKITT